MAKKKNKVKSAAQLGAQKTEKKNSSRKSEAEWPNKRNIFFRPERMKYVRKLVKEDGCVFCRSAQKPQSVATLCVFKTQHSQIVLNKYPYNNGHLLVLPLEHCGNMFDLSIEQYNDLHTTLRIAMEATCGIYQPHGFNIGMNHGAAGGAGIPDHLHYHIVPRWSGDLNFFPLIADTKLVIETVESTYQKYAEYFNKRSV